MTDGSPPTRDPAPPFDRSVGRCPWASADGPSPDGLMVEYHDTEWGVPVHDDTELFERLALESFQAGLSWSTILYKREAFREAFIKAGLPPGARRPDESGSPQRHDH